MQSVDRSHDYISFRWLGMVSYTPQSGQQHPNCFCFILKVRTVFKDIKPEVLYDVLHDPEYRKTWDHTMLEGYEICAINPNNDIGYYASKYYTIHVDVTII